MVGSSVIQVVAVVGFLTTVAAGSVYLYTYVPGVYPRKRTRLDPRTYRIVRTSLAVGTVIGAFGAVLSIVDTVGSIRAMLSQEAGLLAGVAILVPAWLGPTIVRVGGGLLVGAASLAGVIELRNALER